MGQDWERKLTVDELVRLSRLRAMFADGSARTARRAACIGRGEIAEACGVARWTVVRWEIGTSVPATRRALCYLDFIERVTDTSGPGWPD